jgi:hypothetical protein
MKEQGLPEALSSIVSHLENVLRVCPEAATSTPASAQATAVTSLEKWSVSQLLLMLWHKSCTTHEYTVPFQLHFIAKRPAFVNLNILYALSCVYMYRWTNSNSK